MGYIHCTITFTFHFWKLAIFDPYATPTGYQSHCPPLAAGPAQRRDVLACRASGRRLINREQRGTGLAWPDAPALAGLRPCPGLPHSRGLTASLACLMLPGGRCCRRPSTYSAVLVIVRAVLYCTQPTQPGGTVRVPAIIPPPALLSRQQAGGLGVSVLSEYSYEYQTIPVPYSYSFIYVRFQFTQCMSNKKYEYSYSSNLRTIRGRAGCCTA